MTIQVWEFWSGLGPLGRALTFSPLGISIGSFLSVLLHRLPLGADPVRGRSQCTTCSTTLGMAEMIPVLSYLVQRGRCRYCQATISPIYPLLELGTGIVAATGGLFSWSAGLAVLGVLVGATWVEGTRARTRKVAGFMLVEVIVAFLLLALSIGAVLDLFGIVRYALPAGSRRTQAIALARAEYSRLALGASRDLSSACQNATLSGAEVLQISDPVGYQVTVSASDVSSERCTVTITVTCPSCKSKYGQALNPVRIQGYILAHVPLEAV